MMATVPHVIFGLGLRKFQADGFLLTRVYIKTFSYNLKPFLHNLLNTDNRPLNLL